MTDALYLFFRGGSGFALMVIGAAHLVKPQGGLLSRSYGRMNLAVGAAFCLSALDPVLSLQVDLGNLVLGNLMLVLGQST